MIQARKNILNMFSIINSLVILVSGFFALQQLFSRPVTRPVIPEPVVVEIPKPPPPQVAPKPLEIEKVEIKPKATPLPPLPKIVPKPIPKPIETVVAKPVEPIAPPKPAPIAKMNMDNFNSSSKHNSLGGFTGTFGGTGGFCLESYQKGSAFGSGEDGGNILKLVYNVNNGYAGYYSKLNDADLTKYRRVTFAVKGAKGGEVFEIELGDGTVSSKVDIRDYLPYGASTTWQKVAIPFKAFTEVKNWKKMKGNFAIVFEQYLGTPTNSTLYVDSINFEE